MVNHQDACFAIYIGNPAAGEDEFVPRLSCRQLIERLHGLGAGSSVHIAEMNIRRHLEKFSDLSPVRISIEKILSGIDASSQKKITAWLRSNAQRFEPDYSSTMEVTRRQNDGRLHRAERPPCELIRPYQAACKDILAAKNLIFHHVMTSVYRIVISSYIDYASRGAVAITARDSRRDSEELCRTVLCWPEGDAWLFWAEDDDVPSSSFVSFWTCHNQLRTKCPNLSAAIVHCHTREALDLFKSLRPEDRTSEFLSRGIGLVEGPTRSAEFGRKLAGGFAAGTETLLLPQEGTYVAGASVMGSAERTVRVAAKLRLATCELGLTQCLW